MHSYKLRISSIFEGRKEKALAVPDYRWLFVGDIPLLYEKKRVARQLKIETWLDLSQLLQDLKLKKLERGKVTPKGLSYLV